MQMSVNSVRFVLPSACLLLGLWLPSVGTSAQAVPWPGRIPASIHLGMPRADVWKHLGKPPETHALRVAGQKYTWDEWSSDSREWAVISQRGRVVQTEYRCHADALRHPTFSAFRRQHPHLRLSLYSAGEDVGKVMVADDIERGVAWTLYIHYPQGFFPDHSIAWDPMNVDPSRIIQHRPGRPALPPSIGDEPIKDALMLHNLRAWFAVEPPKSKAHKGN